MGIIALHNCCAARVLLCSSTDARAQLFCFGIKGGTPISSSKTSATYISRLGTSLIRLNIRPYTIGPTFEIALPLDFRFEADALYKRLDRATYSFLSPNYGTITRVAAGTWEFPLLLKRAWDRARYHPFAAAGGTFRRIESFDGSTEYSAGGQQTPYKLKRYRIEESLTHGGVVLGAGVRFTAIGPLKLTPEIRYTRGLH